MKISNTRPPQWVWDQAHRQFEIDDSRTIYTYGDTLHNPAPIKLDDFLVAHESVHARQQAEIGPDVWWARYFSTPVFLLEQEVEAYSTQYREFCHQCKDRNTQDRYLRKLSEILADPMYGGIISETSARNRIKYHSPTQGKGSLPQGGGGITPPEAKRGGESGQTPV